jgi:hypothetical protein
VFSEWNSSPSVKKVTRRKMVENYGFTVIDASHSIGAVFAALKQQMAELLSPAPVVFRDSIGRLKPLRNGTARPAVLASNGG